MPIRPEDIPCHEQIQRAKHKKELDTRRKEAEQKIDAALKENWSRPAPQPVLPVDLFGPLYSGEAKAGTSLHDLAMAIQDTYQQLGWTVDAGEGYDGEHPFVPKLFARFSRHPGR